MLGQIEDLNFATLVRAQVSSCIALFINRQSDFQFGSRTTEDRTDGTTETTEDLMMGSDIFVELPEGDVAAGQVLAEQTLGCTACHTLTAVGPSWEAADGLPGMGVRGGIHIQQDNYTGNATSSDQYLIESVVETNIHIVEGFQPNIMPNDFGERVTLQDMADLLAFLKTFE